MDKTKFNDWPFEAFLDEIPQAIIWLKPIWDGPGQTITDFEYAYSNEEGFKFMGIHPDQIPGLLLSSSPTLADDQRALIFRELVQVYQTDKKSKTNIFNHALNKYAKVLRFKFHGGILSIIQDVTEENRIITELEREKTFSNRILDASVNGIFAAAAIRDHEGDIIDFLIQRINPAFTQVLGLTEQQVKGRLMLSLFPESKETGVFDMHKRVCETGVPEKMEVESENKKEWYYISSVKLNEGILVTFQDITAQKKATEAIEQQRNLLKNILDHSPVGISVTAVTRDENGVVVDGRTLIANDHAAAFTQMSKEELLSKTITEIDPNILTSSLYQQALHTLKTGNPFHTQYYFSPLDRWLELSVAKMDADHLVNIFTDVTSIKEAQLELERSFEELKRSNANLEEFAYAASHDMKEPLRKIRFYADLLNIHLKGKLNEVDQRYLQRIEKATERMTLLVEDLLLYSQVNRGTNLLEWVNLNDKIQLVLEDLELLVREKQAVISVGNLPTVKGHRRQLQQIFTNLIANALRYSKPNEIPRIELQAQTVAGQETGLKLLPEEMTKLFHLIEVRDNGIGFEQKDAESIFNVFTQLHDSKEERGTGLGLAIARKAAENHGGYITAESKPGRGSTFKVYLPAHEEMSH